MRERGGREEEVRGGGREGEGRREGHFCRSYCYSLKEDKMASF